MIVQVITVRLLQTQNHGNLRPADGAPARLLLQVGDARRTESLMPTRHKRKSCITLLDETHFAHILRRRCTDRKSGALSCRLMHSCSAMDRHVQHAVLHSIAFLAFSCLAFSASPLKNCFMQSSSFACLGYWPTVGGWLSPVLTSLLYIQLSRAFCSTGTNI